MSSSLKASSALVLITGMAAVGMGLAAATAGGGAAPGTAAALFGGGMFTNLMRCFETAPAGLLRMTKIVSYQREMPSS